MSQDLFAAFGDPAPEPTVSAVRTEPQQGNTPLQNAQSGTAGLSTQASVVPAGEDDDFGDFEDANAFKNDYNSTATAARNFPPTTSGAQRTPFPPKAEKKSIPVADPDPPDSKIGKHPFAGHMDFLFDAGDDEYDAGADSLDNLASNPEAAMAYSKRIIAEQEARSRSGSDPSKLYAQQLAAHTKELSQKVPQAAISQSTRILAEQQTKMKKLTKAPPNSIAKTQATANPPPARNKLQKKSGYVPAKDPSVLFDADNLSDTDEGDDDFGDFEGGPSVPIATVSPTPPEAPPVRSTMPSIDLLGLDDAPKPVPLGQVGRSRSASMRQADSVLGPPKHTPSNSLSSQPAAVDNPWADFEAETPKATTSRNRVVESMPVTDDAWDDFEAAEPLHVATQPATKSTTHTNNGHNRSESQLPPTNIPPPALLLSIFPSIFSAAQDALLGPLSKLESSQRNQLLAHPASSQFLKSFLNSALVLAHIIAGRKYRWKRDQILSQSMRIGPAAAGGKGGMKLAGVDRSEVTKEEREVLDTVKQWKAQVGKLRIAVSGAAAAGQKLPPVPDISEQMPVKTLKAVEGGFIAPHACALCGLKREERIAKIDENVEDSFGEWWVQGMDMHLFCKNWWEENKNKLKSR